MIEAGFEVAVLWWRLLVYEDAEIKPNLCACESFEDPRDADDAIYGRDGYDFDGVRLRRMVADTPHQIATEVTVVVAVAVVFPGALTIVYWSLDCLLLFRGRIRKITCVELAMSVFHKCSVTVVVS
ncbi:hypothetical protein ACFXTO_033524 [Malus domestica]